MLHLDAVEGRKAEALPQMCWVAQWQVDWRTVEDLVLVADPHPGAAPQIHWEWQAD